MTARSPRYLVPDGTDNVAVNTPIAVIAGEGEDAAAVQAPAAPAEAEAASASGDGHGGEKPVARAETAPSPPPAPAAAITIADRLPPEIPEGTAMVTQSVREALRDAMAEEMRRDASVFIIGEEVAEYEGAYKVTQGLLQEFGARRVVDTPITEHGFAGLGIGAAFAGLRPIVEFMTFNFAMQAMDQIINSAAKTRYMSGGQMECPIVFRGPNGAAARVAAQHSQDYAAWYSHVPGLKVVMPFTAADAKGLLKSAIRDPNPVIFLENEILYGHKFEVPKLDDFLVPIGKARIARAGEGCHHRLLWHRHGACLEGGGSIWRAKASMPRSSICAPSARWTATSIIQSVKKTGRCVTVEEGWPQSGVGAEIMAKIMEEAFDYLDAPVLRICGKDVPIALCGQSRKTRFAECRRDCRRGESGALPLSRGELCQKS